MRNKVITFCAAMGIPISSWGSTFGCRYLWQLPVKLFAGSGGCRYFIC
ncbi:MAG: hypothetical protein ACLR2G_11460 [Phascolarctobacterium faecium]